MAGREAHGSRLDVDVSPTSRGAPDRLGNGKMHMHLRRVRELTESLAALVRQDPHVGPRADREQHGVELVPEIVARIDLRQVIEADDEIVLRPHGRLPYLWRC